MKKNRPGTLLTVVAPPELRASALRHHLPGDDDDRPAALRGRARSACSARSSRVDTPVGPVRFKLAWRDGRVVNAVPEFEDCAALAASAESVRQGRAGDRASGVRHGAPTPIAHREPLLHHHADLLHQRGAASRPRLHDDGGRRRGARAPADGRRCVLPDRHRRARPEGRAGRAEGRRADARRSPTATSQKFRDILPRAERLERRFHPDDRAAALSRRRRRSGAACSDRGFIYKGKYEGWYCTVDEVFVPETQLVDGQCPICGSAVERHRGGELLLQAVGVPAAAPRALRAASRSSSRRRFAGTRWCRSSRAGSRI